MRRSLATAAGTVLGLVCLVYFFAGVDFGELSVVLVGASPGCLALAVLASQGMNLFRAFRWRVLLEPVAPIGLGSALSYTYIHFGANILLPARAGEFIKPLLVKKETGRGYSAVFATVVIERILDLVVILAVLSIVLGSLGPVSFERTGCRPAEARSSSGSVAVRRLTAPGRSPVIQPADVGAGPVTAGNDGPSMPAVPSVAGDMPATEAPLRPDAPGRSATGDTLQVRMDNAGRRWLRGVRYAGWVMACVTLGAMIVLAGLVIARERTMCFVDFLLRPVPRMFADSARKMVVLFVEGLAVVRSPARLALAVLYTSAIWLLNIWVFWLVGKAFGLDIGAWGAGLLQSAIAFAVALPQAPGFIGVYQVAAEMGLKILGVSTTPAKAYAISVWVVTAVPMAVIGLVCAVREGVGLVGLSREGLALARREGCS